VKEGKKVFDMIERRVVPFRAQPPPNPVHVARGDAMARLIEELIEIEADSSE
jgi:hypothetical protein